jgi:hypothetical protein
MQTSRSRYTLSPAKGLVPMIFCRSEMGHPVDARVTENQRDERQKHDEGDEQIEHEVVIDVTTQTA